MKQPTIAYNPFLERTPDHQYQDALRRILKEGKRSESAHETGSLSLFGQVNFCFDLKNGFPMITERNMAPQPSNPQGVSPWQQAIGEILAFINGVHTQEGLEEFGCPAFWRDTVTGEEGKRKTEKRGLVEGDLGPASYGAVFAHHPLIDVRLLARLEKGLSPKANQEFQALLKETKALDGFNQVEAILRQIKDRPELRTHFLDPWYSPGIWRWDQQVVVCPCHGWIHLRVIEGELYYNMYQRSGDMFLGVPNNIVEHVALAMAFSRATGYPLVQYSHQISDPHIYLNQVEAAEKVIARAPRRFPTVTLRDKVTDLFAVRREDYILTDYYPHPGITGVELSV